MVTSSRANAWVAFLVPSMTGNWNGPFISAQYFFSQILIALRRRIWKFGLQTQRATRIVGAPYTNASWLHNRQNENGRQGRARAIYY